MGKDCIPFISNLPLDACPRSTSKSTRDPCSSFLPKFPANDIPHRALFSFAKRQIHLHKRALLRIERSLTSKPPFLFVCTNRGPFLFILLFSECLRKRVPDWKGSKGNFFGGGGGGGGSDLDKKISLVSWATVCLDESKGGVGIKSFSKMNKALLCKWSWRFANDRNAL